MAELLAIQAGLHLLHTQAGASLVISCRTYLSDSISLKWIKGHPERSDVAHTSWTRQQWGNYIADGLSKNRDIGSLPFSHIPTIRTHIFLFLKSDEG